MSKRLLIAAGGTGGHISAGIAVAQEWRRKGGEVFFVGAGKELEKKMLKGFEIFELKVRPLKGVGIYKGLLSLLSLPLAVLKARSILRQTAPDVVLGIGGYVAGPICIASWFLRKPFGILEENSVMGFTNKVLERIADVVFIGVEAISPEPRNDNVIYSGNPLREEVKANAYLPYRDKQGEFTLLVMGGSQGARFLNDKIPEVVKTLKDDGVNIKVIHQTGSSDYERVKKFYSEHNIAAEVFPFDEKLYLQFKKVHLAISRAGAMSIAELAFAGIPVILIPYPYAADNHQHKNARIVEEKGGGICITQPEVEAGKLKKILSELIKDRERLIRMSDAMRKMIRIDSAEVICRRLRELCK